MGLQDDISSRQRELAEEEAWHRSLAGRHHVEVRRPSGDEWSRLAFEVIAVAKRSHWQVVYLSDGPDGSTRIVQYGTNRIAWSQRARMHKTTAVVAFGSDGCVAVFRDGRVATDQTLEDARRCLTDVLAR